MRTIKLFVAIALCLTLITAARAQEDLKQTLQTEAAATAPPPLVDKATTSEQSASLAPDSITYRNLIYGIIDGMSLLMTIDVPRNQGPPPPEGWPTILAIHGGGWFAGNRDWAEAGPERLRGYIVARIEYRLSDTWKFPAAIHDVKAAVRYLRKNAGLFRIDPNRIAAWGNSAGAHLAVLLGMSCHDPYLEGRVGTALGYNSCVQAVVDVSAPNDFTKLNEQQYAGCSGYPRNFDKPGNIYSRFVANGASWSTQPYLVGKLNPIRYASADDPPTLIVHGTADCIVPYPQSVDLFSTLQGQGVDTTLISITNAPHGIVIYQYEEVKTQVQAWLDSHLKPAPAQRTRPRRASTR